MDLSIIVVSYNTADLIEKCLHSITAANRLEKEIFVVDNASLDDSAAIIKEMFPSVDLMVNSCNRGFAAANNQVLPHCRGQYLFFLNPDTEVMPDTFREALSFMEENPRCGLAGTRIINPDGTLQESIAYRYPGQQHAAGELAGLKGHIAFVLGAGMIARTDVIKKIGGFDEDFFLYGEDQDLCLRMRTAGYEIGYISSAVVVHLGGQSERRFTSGEVWKKKMQAELLFYQKHYLPETIRRNLRGNLIKACWRIITLNLFMPFMKNKNRAQGKLIKYRTIYETIKSSDSYKNRKS
ncbi:MAG: glycosyltransferase family 2 protein [Syntrophales bacterium]